METIAGQQTGVDSSHGWSAAPGGSLDLVGELVTVQARLNQKAFSQRDGELHEIAEEVSRLSEELRDNTMGIRMLPIGTTFNKFKRLVRDLANDLGKEIVLSTEGAETKLDKTVIDQLNDPMVHLIRNAIQQRKLTTENIQLRRKIDELSAFDEIIGDGTTEHHFIIYQG